MLEYIAYGVMGFIVFCSTILVIMNSEEWKHGTAVKRGDVSLFFFGLLGGVFWPVTLVVAAGYFGYVYLLTLLVRLNDKRFQEWIALGEVEWAQALWDRRLKAEISTKSRCAYCHGPLVRTAHFMGWEPCPKEECRTIFSMSEEAKKQYEVIKQNDEAAARMGASRKRQIQPAIPNTINTPYITSPNTSGTTWGGSNHTTTASYDYGDHQHKSNKTYPATSVNDAIHYSTTAAVTDAYIMGILKDQDEYARKLSEQSNKNK